MASEHWADVQSSEDEVENEDENVVQTQEQRGEEPVGFEAERDDNLEERAEVNADVKAAVQPYRVQQQHQQRDGAQGQGQVQGQGQPRQPRGGNYQPRGGGQQSGRKDQQSGAPWRRDGPGTSGRGGDTNGSGSNEESFRRFPNSVTAEDGAPVRQSSNVNRTSSNRDNASNNPTRKYSNRDEKVWERGAALEARQEGDAAAAVSGTGSGPSRRPLYSAGGLTTDRRERSDLGSSSDLAASDSHVLPDESPLGGKADSTFIHTKDLLKKKAEREPLLKACLDRGAPYTLMLLNLPPGTKDHNLRTIFSNCQIRDTLFEDAEDEQGKVIKTRAFMNVSNDVSLYRALQKNNQTLLDQDIPLQITPCEERKDLRRLQSGRGSAEPRSPAVGSESSSVSGADVGSINLNEGDSRANRNTTGNRNRDSNSGNGRKGSGVGRKYSGTNLNSKEGGGGDDGREGESRKPHSDEAEGSGENEGGAENGKESETTGKDNRGARNSNRGRRGGDGELRRGGSQRGGEGRDDRDIVRRDSKKSGSTLSKSSSNRGGAASKDGFVRASSGKGTFNSNVKTDAIPQTEAPVLKSKNSFAALADEDA